LRTPNQISFLVLAKIQTQSNIVFLQFFFVKSATSDAGHFDVAQKREERTVIGPEFTGQSLKA
jgi:hypothetical protein